MRSLHCLHLAAAAVLLAAPAAWGQGGMVIQVDQGLTDAVLDKPVTAQITGGDVFDVFHTLAAKSGVPIQVDLRTNQVLPGPVAMPIRNISFTGVPLRAALDALCAKFGLQYKLLTDKVWVEPSPQLVALGRRATVGELAALSRLRGTFLQGGGTPVSLKYLLDFIDQQLKIPPELSPEMAQAANGKTWQFAGVTSLAAALDAACRDLQAAWTVADGKVSLLGLAEMARRRIEVQLATPATVDFAAAPLYAVIAELARQAGVTAYFQPGALLGVPTATRERFALQMRGATVRQAFETICGVTGLEYRIEPDGVYFGLSAAAVTAGGDMLAEMRRNPMVAFMRYKVGALEMSVPIRKNDLPDAVYQILMQQRDQYIRDLSRILAPSIAPPNVLPQGDNGGSTTP